MLALSSALLVSFVMCMIARVSLPFTRAVSYPQRPIIEFYRRERRQAIIRDALVSGRGTLAAEMTPYFLYTPEFHAHVVQLTLCRQAEIPGRGADLN